MAKHIRDMKHVSSVTAWALVRNGRHVGNLIANWSDNPNGSVCTCNVVIWDRDESGPLRGTSATGRAGGGGYDKLSAAFADAMGKDANGVEGRGESQMKSWLREREIEVYSVIG